jgi:hypothetical protein
MGQITISEFVSMDGVMEAPGGEPGYKHTGWVSLFPDEGQFAYKFDEVTTHDALLVGRVTYESFAGAWPTYEGEFADRMNSMPKFVVSNTLQEAKGVVRRQAPRRRQPHACSGPEAARLGRRVPSDGVPHRPRQRIPRLRERRGDGDDGPRRRQAVRFDRQPDLPPLPADKP